MPSHYDLLGGQPLSLSGSAPIPQPVEEGTPEFESRVQGWRERLRDPAIQNALISFGAVLLQPQQVGQTGAGQFGLAALEGLGAMERTGILQQERAALAAKTGREEKKIGLLEKQIEFQEEEARRKGRREEELLPLEKQEKEASIRKTESDIGLEGLKRETELARVKAAQARINAIIAGRGSLDELRGAQTELAKAQTERALEGPSTADERVMQSRVDLLKKTGVPEDEARARVLNEEAQREAQVRGAIELSKFSEGTELEERFRTFSDLLKEGEGNIPVAALKAGKISESLPDDEAMGLPLLAESVRSKKISKKEALEVLKKKGWTGETLEETATKGRIKRRGEE